MASVTSTQQGLLAVCGKIDFDNAEQIYQQGMHILQQDNSSSVLLDLSQLEHGNTLALAIFIQWLRACPNPDGLKLKNVPNKMLGIIRASHLEQLVTQ